MTPGWLFAALAALVACRDKSEPPPAPPPPQQRQPQDRDDLVTYQDLVAISSTGRAFVTRKEHQLTVWTRAGTKLGVLDAIGTDAPGDRVAISANGDRLAQLTTTEIRVVDVATKKPAWQVDASAVVWGDPAFSPDGRVLALPLEGSVMTLDAASGKEVARIDADKVARGYPVGRPLSLPRTLWYAPDGTYLAIGCGTDHEQFANHTVFVADTRSNELVWAVLGHAGSVIDAQWLADGRLVTLDEAGTLRLIRDGLVEQTLALPDTMLGTLAVAEDLKTVALGGDKAISVWRAGKGIVQIPRHRLDDPIVRLELSPDKVVAISRKGGVVRAYSIPAAAPAATAAWVTIDPVTRQRDAALWRIANGENPRVPKADDKLIAAARAFAAWQRAGAHGAYKGLLDLDLIDRYITGGLVDEAHVLLATWLAGTHGADDERAKQLGLALAAAERSNDLEQPIATALYARWPDDPKVVLAYTDEVASAAPELAFAALRKATVRMPHEVELWRQWLELTEADEAKQIYASARKVLTPDELGKLPAPK